MRIVILATGTRGDLQPSLALGLRLRRAGYAVRLVAGANFAAWIEQHGLPTYSTLSSVEVLGSPEGLGWVQSRGGFGELNAMRKLSCAFAGRVADDILRSTGGADLLIGGMYEEPYLQAVAEKYGLMQLTFALQPYRPTRSGAATLVPLRTRSVSALNRWASMVTRRLLWTIASTTTNRIRAELGLAPHSPGSFFRVQRSIPVLYAFSRHVVPIEPQPNEHTTGYCFLEHQTPLPDALLRFISAGPAPVYVGFGSMPNSNPAATLRLVGDVLARLGCRGVLALPAGVPPGELPKHLCVAPNVDHARLFPMMAAVVHHGGAGTTAAGLLAGVPALIVPHMADQPFWGRRVFELGAGVEPLPRVHFTAGRFEQRLHALLGDTSLRTTAATLGNQIRTENGVENAANWITQHIEIAHHKDTTGARIR
jgi:sterol 3beta-glucosyltransferase